MPRPPPSNEIREGTRGGWGHFKWEDVKTDKHRTNYLANSLFAPVGRWQQGRDLTWYAKKSAVDATSSAPDDQRQREVAEIKRREQEYMNAALGYGPLNPAAAYSSQPQVSEQELKTILAKTKTLPTGETSLAMNEAAVEAEQEEMQMERGLGYGHSATATVSSMERLEGTVNAGIVDLKTRREEEQRKRRAVDGDERRGSPRDPAERRVSGRRNEQEPGSKRRRRRDRSRSRSREEGRRQRRSRSPIAERRNKSRYRESKRPERGDRHRDKETSQKY